MAGKHQCFQVRPVPSWFIAMTLMSPVRMHLGILKPSPVLVIFLLLSHPLTMQVIKSRHWAYPTVVSVRRYIQTVLPPPLYLTCPLRSLQRHHPSSTLYRSLFTHLPLQMHSSNPPSPPSLLHLSPLQNICRSR